MGDKFEMLAPGDACAAALPVNAVKDDYSVTRLVNLTTTEDGETQPVVLPRRVVHPRFAEVLRKRLPAERPERLEGGRALLSKWRAPLEPLPPVASAPPGSVPGVSAQTVDALLPNYEFALYLPYAHTWELLGYSRGALLNSVSLAPQEESTIEIFSWERVKRAREDTLSSERENTQDVAFTDKDTREVLKEVTKDSSFTFHAGLEVKVPVGKVPVGVSVGADTKDALRDVSRSTQQTINEAVRKASVRMKTSRQTKVTESEEFGRETKVTRKLRNPNMCRTLNIDMFEILANYRVSTALLHEGIRLCVLVPIPISMEVNRSFLLAHAGALQRALLSPAYASGFDAARLLATWQRLCEVKCAPPCPCDQGPGAPANESDPAVVAALAQVASAANAVAAAIDAVNSASPNDLCELACLERSGSDADWAAAKVSFHRWLYGKLMDLIASRWWAVCRQFAQDTDRSPDAAERFLQEANVQPADIFNLFTLGIRFIGVAASIVNTLFEEGCWNIFVLVTNIAFDAAGLDAAINRLRSAVSAWRAAVAAAGQPPAEPPGDTPAPVAAAEFPPQELARALVDEGALIAHLDGNAAYYRFVIWEALSPSDRATLLAGHGNLASFTEAAVLGYSGSKIALPFRLASDADVAAWFEGNVRDNPGLKETPAPFPVVLQTPGVMTETRLGQCDACEDFITQHRSLDRQLKAAEVLAAEQRAEQEKLEVQRYQMRLAQKQPILEDPNPNAQAGTLRVILQDTRPKPPEAKP